MVDRDIKNLLGGGVLTLLGLLTIWYVYNHYAVGTFSRMGPGFLPITLGSILTLLGLIVAIPAYWRHGKPIRGDWVSASFVISSIIIFGASLHWLGLIIASATAALVALIPDIQLRWATKVKVAASISAITYLIFILGLNMNLPAWPNIS